MGNIYGIDQSNKKKALSKQAMLQKKSGQGD